MALEAYGQVSDVSELVKPDGTFDESIPEAGMINVGDWPKYIAAGQSRLLASEWHQRFPESDSRSKLTWQNRLLQVPSDKVYNFYSSTEDVLRAYPDDGLATLWGLITNLDGVRDYLATAGWVKQEKFKGRPLPPGVNIAGLTSPFAGWSFSEQYFVVDRILQEPRRYTPEEAAQINTDQLKSEPFFALRTNASYPRDIENIATDIGSEFIDVEIKYTNLASYYTNNAAAHDKVKVRDWLLAEAFPATTLPMGANENGKINNRPRRGRYWPPL